MSKLAWPTINEDWHECMIQFTCPCGDAMFVDDQEEYYVCSCGRKYSLTTHFTVEDLDED